MKTTSKRKRSKPAPRKPKVPATRPKVSRTQPPLAVGDMTPKQYKAAAEAADRFSEIKSPGLEFSMQLLLERISDRLLRVEAIVSKLEGASLGELANLMEDVRTQCDLIKSTEIAHMQAIQRHRTVAMEEAHKRAAVVMDTLSQNFVSTEYFHTWVTRINEQLTKLGGEPA